MNKPKIAISWNSSCGGCDESIVDIEEKLLDVAAQVEFVLWPCAMDFKYENIEKMQDNEIAVALINGGIQNTHQEHIVKLLRKKSKLVVAFGMCAVMGGVPSLANLKNRDEIFACSYLDSPTVINPMKTLPQTQTDIDGHIIELPEIFESLCKLDDIIEVDYYLPGCPPTSNMIVNAIEALLTAGLPPKGSFLYPNKALCSSCNRNDSKPDILEIDEFKRIHQVIADPETCFLAQGILCMGPATRDGCDYPCIKGNMPCTGCNGPMDNADQGSQIISFIGGIIKSNDEEKIIKMLENIPDPAGSFYRYSISASLLGRKRKGDLS